MLVQKKDYEYELIYDKKILGEEEREERIQSLKTQKCKHKVKTIQAGEILESEIYPVWEGRKNTPRKKKQDLSDESLKKYNDKMARRQITRLINTNFDRNDLYVTLTYPDGTLPNEKKARKDMNNYIRRIKNNRKKKEHPELKYIYVIEYVDDEDLPYTKKIRIHHHIIMSQMDRDVAEDLWIKKARVDCRRLQPDDFGLEGIARYLVKGKKGKKRWYGSRNLKKPTVNTSVSKCSKSRARKIALEPDKWQEIFENMYKQKYKLLDVEVYYSEIVAGFYIRARMRRKE